MHPNDTVATLTGTEANATIAYCIVTPYRDRNNALWQIAIPECPYCGATHFHGGGPLTGPPNLGLRVPHCLDWKVRRSDYLLVPIPETTA